MWSRHVLGAVAALVLAGAALCTPAPGAGQTLVGAEEVQRYNANPLTVLVPPGLGQADVEAVIVSTLEGRKWTVVERSPQEIVGTLVHRDFDAKVIVKIGGPGDPLKLLSEARYKAPQTGQFEPAVPKGWLKNLQKDLQTFLSRKAGQG
jgi:hypothetical protein